MSTGISKLFEDSESLADQRRFIPAVQAIEEARRLTKIPDRRAWASYNLGVIYWHHLGNGLSARHEFLESIADFEKYGYGQHPQLRTVHSSALENAMLCALSYDEFENLAARLYTVTPELPILKDLVPEVRSWRERGDSWSSRLFSLAESYYNRNDARRDIGRYAEARSTYHLILTHRRELRLSQENWRLALFEFCALSMRMVSDCAIFRGGDNDPNSPEEFITILTEAIPLVKEYLSLNTGDDDIKKVCADMDQMVSIFRDRWVVYKETINTMQQKTDYQVCQNCGTIFASRDVNGPEFMVGMMNIYDHSRICPKCGGNVVWQSSLKTEPLLGRGCLPIVFFLCFLTGLVMLWLK